jgi:hypothetical protein
MENKKPSEAEVRDSRINLDLFVATAQMNLVRENIKKNITLDRLFSDHPELLNGLKKAYGDDLRISNIAVGTYDISPDKYIEFDVSISYRSLEIGTFRIMTDASYKTVNKEYIPNPKEL